MHFCLETPQQFLSLAILVATAISKGCAVLIQPAALSTLPDEMMKQPYAHMHMKCCVV